MKMPCLSYGARRMEMDKIMSYYNEYYDKIMVWYGGLTFLEQMGVLFVLFVCCFACLAYFFIKKAAGG